MCSMQHKTKCHVMVIFPPPAISSATSFYLLEMTLYIMISMTVVVDVEETQDKGHQQFE